MNEMFFPQNSLLFTLANFPSFDLWTLVLLVLRRALLQAVIVCCHVCLRSIEIVSLNERECALPKASLYN